MSNLNIRKENSIGVFDSGVGGIGVLKELVTVLPNEDFIYYGDSLHAPYGEKTEEHVFQLVQDSINYILSKNVKAIVIACNTATSIAVNRLREMHPEISIIGMEPAIKKAVDEDKKNKVLVMATPMTLKLDKYLTLQQSLEEQADFIALSCPGLAKRIEHGNFESDDLKEMLKGFIGPYKGKIDHVVLGCTHYPFIRKQIKEVLGDLPIVDGGRGTALQCKRLLAEKDLLKGPEYKGSITFESSKDTEEEISLYRTLYDMYEIY